MSVRSAILIAVIVLCAVPLVHGAFYKYRDADGRTVYVDHLDKVPDAFKDTVTVYAEPVDGMTAAERKAYEANEARQEAARREQYRKHVRAIMAKPRRPVVATSQSPVTTPIEVVNDQVLVPVTLGYRGVTVTTRLLLDTGANITTLHEEVAEALGLRRPKRTSMQVAGGRRIRAGIARLDHIALGTIRLEDVEAGIIEHQGADEPFDGLLGMNVLRQVSFKIDLEKRRITWRQAPGDPSR